MAKHILNLQRDPVLTMLPWIMAMATLVFGISLIASITAFQNSGWGGDLARDEAVVVVPWQVDKLTQKERINRVVELIIETPGLSDARIMSEEEQQELLKPWLGENLATNRTEPLALAIPTLVKLRVDPESRLDKFRLQLSQVVDDAQLVLNQQGRDEARRLTKTVLWFLGFALLLSLASMMLVIVFAVKILLRSQADTIETLQQLGATRTFIRKQFLAVAMRIGLVGGFLAAIFILLMALTLWMSIPHGTLARYWLDSSWIVFPIAIFCIGIVTASVAWLGTRYGLLQTLRNLENLNKV